VEPIRIKTGCGAMISLIRGSGLGYAGTSDISSRGRTHAKATEKRGW
jgi:hypothetical protein